MLASTGWRHWQGFPVSITFASKASFYHMDFLVHCMFDCTTKGRRYMHKLLALLVFVLVLSGCGTVNTGIRSLQFNGESQPFPTDYRQLAAEAVKDRPVASGATLQVSYPQVLPGRSAFTPMRWYVCVRGIHTTRTPSTRLKPLYNMVEDKLNPPAGIFDVVLLLPERGDPRVLMETFDAPTCRTARFEPLPPAA